MELYCVLFFLLVVSGAAFTMQDGFRDFYPEYTYMTDSNSRRTMEEFRPRITEAPFMALIFADDSFKEYPFITGVIISKRWILTTAKTLEIQKGKRLKALTGVRVIPPLEERHYNYVVDQIMHSNYKANEVYNDIALVKVERNIIFNEEQNSILLMTPSEFSSYKIQYHNRMNLSLYHYGSNDEVSRGILKKSVVSVNTGVVDFTERIFVSAQKSIPTCYGDTGSPAVVDGKLVGLLIIEFSCGRDYPNIFTGVLNYYEWINNAINY